MRVRRVMITSIDKGIVGGRVGKAGIVLRGLGDGLVVEGD